MIILCSVELFDESFNIVLVSSLINLWLAKFVVNSGGEFADLVSINFKTRMKLIKCCQILKETNPVQTWHAMLLKMEMESSIIKGLLFITKVFILYNLKCNSWSLNLDFLSLIRSFEVVRESMHSAISMNKTEVLDSVLNDFLEVKYREQTISDYLEFTCLYWCLTMLWYNAGLF